MGAACVRAALARAACRHRRPRVPAAGASAAATARPTTTPSGNPLPPVVHATLPAGVPGPGGRVLLIGDVHGCCEELRDLLRAMGHTRRDAVVFVGDLVNKGPDSPGVVRLARELGALGVRGNHDDAALARYEAHARGENVGKRWAWVEGLGIEDARWLHALPFSLRLPAHGVLVVHAGLVPGVPLEGQSLSDLYKVREVHREEGGGWLGCEKAAPEGAVPWASAWGGTEHVVFGHDAARGLQRERRATGLDSGCVYGGELTGLVLPHAEEAWEKGAAEMELVSVPAREAYEPIRAKGAK